MREYKPDWVSRGQYEAAVGQEPDPPGRARGRADHPAEPAGPALADLPRRPTDPSSRRRWPQNQEIAARTAYTVDAALVPITAVAKLRDRETSRRWQAHYDLIRGRLLAMKIRCYEYNWACATMKKDALKFKNPKSNAWRLVPDERDPLQRQGGRRGQGGQGPAPAGRRRAPGHPLGPAGRARAEGRRSASSGSRPTSGPIVRPSETPRPRPRRRRRCPSPTRQARRASRSSEPS